LSFPEAETERISLSKIIKNWNVSTGEGRYVLQQEPGFTGSASNNETGKREAEKIIASAREEAQRIWDAARKEGWQKGYEDGFSQGAVAGEKEGLARTNELYRQALNILSETEKNRAERISRLETDIVKLAVAMAEKIITSQLTLDEQIVVQIARSTMKKLVEPRYINIYAHPRDAEILMRQQRLLTEEESESIPIKIIKQSDLSPGSCIIETDKGTVDASMGTQIRELKKELEIA